jgi:toxin HigB-1
LILPKDLTLRCDQVLRVSTISLQARSNLKTKQGSCGTLGKRAHRENRRQDAGAHLTTIGPLGCHRAMNVPGFDFHPLRGFKPTRYSVHVNGPWCITFEFEDGDACRVDFEQYQ